MGGAEAKVRSIHISEAVQNKLQEAATSGDILRINNAIAAGADVNAAEGPDNLTALHLACQRAVFSGRSAAVDALLVAGANPSLRDRWGRLPLHLAAGSVQSRLSSASSAVSAMKLLLKAGADINAARPDGVSTLHISARLGHTEAVEMLIDAGADVNRKASDGCNAFAYAVQSANLKVAEMLLHAGASVDTLIPLPSRGQCIPLLQLAICRQPLFELIAPVAVTELRAVDSNGQTTLFTARPPLLKDLIKLGVDVHHRDPQGRTALHLRAIDSSAARALVSAGADVNAQDLQGMTVLHLACGCRANRRDRRRAEQLRMVTYLLSEGADPSIRNLEGMRPVDMALVTQNTLVIEMLSNLRPTKLP